MFTNSFILAARDAKMGDEIMVTHMCVFIIVIMKI